MSDNSYLRALEMRLAWLRWMGSPDSNEVFAEGNIQEVIEGNMRDIAGYSLASATATYFMSRPFCELVDHLRRTAPNDMKFDLKWLQTTEGFIWFESPFVNANYTSWRAMTWCRVMDGSINRLVENTFQITFYVDFADEAYLNRSFGFTTSGSFFIKDGCSLGDADVETMKQMPEYADKDAGLTMIHLAYSALHLMGQRLAVSTEARPDRGTRRRLERDYPEEVLPPVQVITLRRLEQQGIHSTEPRSVDWHWQWIVDKHWRRQYYPATGEYKYIVIDRYIKGPEDRPLKPPRAKIFVANR